MAYINKQGYLERNPKAGRKNPNGKASKRNWWFVVALSYKDHNKLYGRVEIHSVHFPEHMIGKKVRFKMEIIEEKTP